MSLFPFPIFFRFMRDSPHARLALESERRFGALGVIQIYVNGVPYLLISQHAVNFSELD